MKRPNNSGFTIIETLLVLGMAGLIFLMIFNVVPTLIRNGHNNQRKQEVTTMLSAVSHYQLNNSGSFPPAPAAPLYGFLQYVNLSHYDKSAIKVFAQSAGDNPTINTVPDEQVHLYNYHLCDTANPGATSAGAGYRDIVAIYKIETKSGLDVKCQQL